MEGGHRAKTNASLTSFATKWWQERLYLLLCQNVKWTIQWQEHSYLFSSLFLPHFFLHFTQSLQSSCYHLLICPPLIRCSLPRSLPSPWVSGRGGGAPGRIDLAAAKLLWVGTSLPISPWRQKISSVKVNLNAFTISQVLILVCFCDCFLGFV